MVGISNVFESFEITYIALFVFRAHTIALEHSKLAVKQQVTKAFDTVALPVFDEGLEFFNSLDAFFARNSVVCAGKYGRGCIDTSCEVGFSLLVKVAVLL